MELETIKTIAELASGGNFNESAGIVKKANNYLNAGWVLLGIHRRGYDDTRDGGSSLEATVYIFGHTEVNQPKPKMGPTAQEIALSAYIPRFDDNP